MDGDGQNYSVFNSRMLVDTVGDITDDALKASRIKDVIGVLVGRVFNWSQRKSLFPLHLGIKCCALEMAAAGASRFDAERFGVFFRSSPRQCDVLLVNGPISKKFADPIVRLWEQMPEPKWCIAMGECAISGGPYFQSYNILEGVDTVIPVDVYIPGCPQARGPDRRLRQAQAEDHQNRRGPGRRSTRVKEPHHRRGRLGGV